MPQTKSGASGHESSVGVVRCPAIARTRKGSAEGRSHFALFTIPQEWGIKGVETRMRRRRWWAQPTLRDCAGGFRSALSTLHLDSRLRGNDRPFGGLVGTASAVDLARRSGCGERPEGRGVPQSPDLQREVQRGSAPLPGTGVSPDSSFSPPKIVDPPQEEWGSGG
jgi:hypothetical protein